MFSPEPRQTHVSIRLLPSFKLLQGLLNLRICFNRASGFHEAKLPWRGEVVRSAVSDCGSLGKHESSSRFSSHYSSTYKGKFTLGRLVLRHHHLYTAK